MQIKPPDYTGILSNDESKNQDQKVFVFSPSSIQNMLANFPLLSSAISVFLDTLMAPTGNTTAPPLNPKTSRPEPSAPPLDLTMKIPSAPSLPGTTPGLPTPLPAPSAPTAPPPNAPTVPAIAAPSLPNNHPNILDAAALPNPNPAGINVQNKAVIFNPLPETGSLIQNTDGPQPIPTSEKSVLASITTAHNTQNPLASPKIASPQNEKSATAQNKEVLPPNDPKAQPSVLKFQTVGFSEFVLFAEVSNTSSVAPTSSASIEKGSNPAIPAGLKEAAPTQDHLSSIPTTQASQQTDSHSTTIPSSVSMPSSMQAPPASPQSAQSNTVSQQPLPQEVSREFIQPSPSLPNQVGIEIALSSEHYAVPNQPIFNQSSPQTSPNPTMNPTQNPSALSGPINAGLSQPTAMTMSQNSAPYQAPVSTTTSQNAALQTRSPQSYSPQQQSVIASIFTPATPAVPSNNPTTTTALAVPAAQPTISGKAETLSSSPVNRTNQVAIAPYSSSTPVQASSPASSRLSGSVPPVEAVNDHNADEDDEEEEDEEEDEEEEGDEEDKSGCFRGNCKTRFAAQIR